MRAELIKTRTGFLPVNRSTETLQLMSADYHNPETEILLPEIVFITSYPPRECGIATYSQDLVKALHNKFKNSFSIQICPLESDHEKHIYTGDIKYKLNTDHPNAFIRLANKLNDNDNIRMVVIQHEFGFFEKKGGNFKQFLNTLTKPVVLVFHTVLPKPDTTFKTRVQGIAGVAKAIIVMTHSSAEILKTDYAIAENKIQVIPHGTHLVPHAEKIILKEKYGLTGKKVLATFGLLSSGKGIETTLDALPEIVKRNPDVLFLIIGKTHPSVITREGEKYRDMLEAKTAALHLEGHVKFINEFLPLHDLLEYLQLTDIYLFTSKDPNQAVSGTFSYAMSCGCPVISTPIPHAREVLQHDAGIIVDFEQPAQLTAAVNDLLDDDLRRERICLNGLQHMASTAWENAAIAHAMLFEKIAGGSIALTYKIPPTNLDHIKKITTDFGIIQFSKVNRPDISSGYTLDDNARALIAMCQHFEHTRNEKDMKYILIYFNFIKYCQQPDGSFLNYVNSEQEFTPQNKLTDLADANGRAIWALGYLISLQALFPQALIAAANTMLENTLHQVADMHATRAMAFTIKGLYYRNISNNNASDKAHIKLLADRLIQMYRHEKDHEWHWFESYLTYANSLLPEALLCAWLATNKSVYKDTAKAAFDFLLSKTFSGNRIKLIANKNWLHKNDVPYKPHSGGEQPIDVAYTIIALAKFYGVFQSAGYLLKMETAFNWFLGNNHLHQVIYNPCTGGCFDGLEEHNVNLNQGAESTLSYLMAKLAVEKTKHHTALQKNSPVLFQK